MNRIMHLSFLAVIFAAPSASAQSEPSTATTRVHGQEAIDAKLDRDVLARLDLAMQRSVEQVELSGVIGLVHHNGHRGYFEAFGWQNIEAKKPMPKDAIFRLKSMSKPVVTVAALVLLDEGKFLLDEPIAKHLPEWKEPKVLENGELVSARTQITPRMLMTHSSGLYYQLPGKAAFSGMPPRNEKTTLEEYSQALASQPLLFHPGDKYQYGTSIDVLGRYIEAVSDQPLDEFLRQRVFEPLGMNDTDFWIPEPKQDRLAQLYRQPSAGKLAPAFERYSPTRPTKLYMGGAGLMSTAEDYERFCLMLMNRGELEGKRVLKSETVDLMFQNHLPESLGQKYGLGGAVDGEGGYSWGGANGTQFWIDRQNNLFAIFMVQTQNYKAPTYNAFRSLVNEASGSKSNQSPARNMFGNALRQRDVNGDGKLDRDELPQALFDRLDRDKDGFVSESELKNLRQR
jgi:CubicO group peptidase (beta-lactamase class C family)